jgi:hypothetical protein
MVGHQPDKDGHLRPHLEQHIAVRAEPNTHLETGVWLSPEQGGGKGGRGRKGGRSNIGSTERVRVRVECVCVRVRMCECASVWACVCRTLTCSRVLSTTCTSTSVARGPSLPWVQRGSRVGPEWVQSGSRVGPEWLQSGLLGMCRSSSCSRPRKSERLLCDGYTTNRAHQKQIKTPAAARCRPCVPGRRLWLVWAAKRTLAPASRAGAAR